MNHCSTLMSLRVAVRQAQDVGQLPYEVGAGRHFQVVAHEVVVPVLRQLVNGLCLEGLAAYLVLAMDEATPYVGLELSVPSTTLWVYPSASPHALMTSVRGGLYADYNSDRQLAYRELTSDTVAPLLIEQLRVVLCPPNPLL